jgi:hypothetical protein
MIPFRKNGWVVAARARELLSVPPTLHGLSTVPSIPPGCTIKIVEHISLGAVRLHGVLDDKSRPVEFSAGDGSTGMVSGPRLRIVTLPAIMATEQPRRKPIG